MIKFIVLLTSAITFNFTLSFGEMLGISQSEKPEEIQLFFTENPLGFESGQPVYPIDTKVFVKSTQEKEFIISVNGSSDLKATGLKVDISNYLNPIADTYTVVVEAKGQESSNHKVFGFTTK
ncbi:MAG: hypothetical protein ABJP45_06640 [Cyclobacteriaceae bacterium]